MWFAISFIELDDFVDLEINNSFGETEILKLSLISLLYMVVDLNSKCILTLANPDACIFTILVLTWIIALIWSMLSTLFRCCI